MFYFYLPFGLSGVTKYYVDIISEAIERLGHDIKTINNLKKLPKRSYILTISDKDTTYAVMRRKPEYVITWFQGVTPEEMDLLYKGRWDHRPRIMAHRFFEKYALKHSNLNLFVSEAMMKHYLKHYKFNAADCYIMPCFGNKLDRNAFTNQKYRVPRFLYSGSITKWQCIDKMLILFKKIKDVIPEASLNILTPDHDKATALLSQYDVTAQIDFIEPDKLQDYIQQFKYGFIVRDDIVVNQVATPTKMSNYMGAGIIPVYSDVVHDYQKHITGKSDYVIAFSDTDDCISKIKVIESTEINATDIASDYASIFDEYWNREYYVNKLTQIISTQLNNTAQKA